MLRRRRARDVLVLAYHNIVPTGTERYGGDASLHLEQKKFTEQLESIQQSYRVVPLASILDPAKAGERPRVAITFDDAYAGALTVGVSELVNRGLPATIFVAPGLIGQQAWWDVLAAQGLLSAEARRLALEELAGDKERVISWAFRSKHLHTVSTYRIGSEDEIRSAANCPGISLGSHTWSHRNLSVLNSTEIESELTRSLSWLNERWGFREWPLSYPYGMLSPPVVKAAADVGYKFAFRVDGGRLRATADLSPFALPRLNVPAGISIDGFRLRLVGLFSE
jgi:peptidoglycan/xylan/chitin deacetylase (PgdA/CDA1 family)